MHQYTKKRLENGNVFGNIFVTAFCTEEVHWCCIIPKSFNHITIVHHKHQLIQDTTVGCQSFWATYLSARLVAVDPTPVSKSLSGPSFELT